MEELNIHDLYDKSSRAQENEFIRNVNSQMQVKTDYEKNEVNTEWIDVMQETIRYIDNILRNPNKFIINEEDIVKIELSKRITVESIKHLSKNTNFIQDIDDETGDVKPSKILNVLKEESYNTYENRFIYTLIKNMRMFIDRKKEQQLDKINYSGKDEKDFQYVAGSRVGKNSVSIDLKISSKSSLSKERKNNTKIEERIEKLENDVKILQSSELYEYLEKNRVAVVHPPIRKTNVILKNVNFQYAIKLWEYMQDNMDDDSKNIKDKKDYKDKGELKDLADEAFYLDYLILNLLSKDEEDEELTEEQKEEERKRRGEITEKLIEKLVLINGNLSDENFKNMILDKIAIIKYKKKANKAEIKEIFKKHFDRYLKQVNA